MARTLSACITLLLALALLGAEKVTASQRFYFNDTNFMLDGNVFQIIAGEVHFARIPEDYWLHRIQMIKSIGCNTLSVYVMWNYHEIQPGVFDFHSYGKNLSKFLDLAAREGMYVLIRPGPYVCAEWDFGGHPYWLLKDEAMVAGIRENSTIYINAM